MTTIPFTKGHGTRNDFVLVFDPDGGRPLTAAVVRQLCDRRSGIGGDGVIRAVHAKNIDVDGGVSGEAWFMDYWNADGSLSEMCGNGARVFGALLEREAGVDLSLGMEFGTRGGVKTVTSIGGGHYSVDMGPWKVPHADQATDSEVTVQGLDTARPGLSVDVGNPHVVLALLTEHELEQADLSVAPVVVPEPAAGANVELVVPLGERLVAGERRGHVRMRVYERGSGETESCGTGACAVALAVRAWAGEGSPREWDIDVPGGTVSVRVDDHRTVLSGPAALVATGTYTLPA